MVRSSEDVIREYNDQFREMRGYKTDLEVGQGKRLEEAKGKARRDAIEEYGRERSVQLIEEQRQEHVEPSNTRGRN